MSGDDATPGEGPRGERIAKWLARAGVASRRDAERLITEGRVRLDNRLVETPATFVRPATSSPWTAGRWPSPSAPACSATTSPPGW